MNENRERKITFQIELLLVFVFLNSIGFPGSYTEIFGDTFGVLVEYGAFAMQIAVMLLSSGNSVLDVGLINIKFQYFPLYQFVVVVFVESMIGAREPTLQLISCIRLTVTVLFAIWVSENIKIDRIVELFCVAQALLDISIILLMVIRPSLAFRTGSGFTHALVGVYSAKNALASEMSFGTILLFMLLLKRHQAQEKSGGWPVVFVVHLIMMFMCQALGAVMVAGMVIVYLLFFTKIRLPLPWLYISVNIGFLFAALTILPYFAPILEAFGKDATLTGRTVLWNGIITFMMANKTLTGYGYGRFWMDKKAVARLHTYFNRTSYFSRMATGAHNQILELWLNTGVIGIGSFFIAVLGSMKNASRLSPGKYRFISPIFYYLLLCGLAERIFENAYGYRLLIFFLIMAICCQGETVEETKNYAKRRNVAENENRNIMHDD